MSLSLLAVLRRNGIPPTAPAPLAMIAADKEASLRPPSLLRCMNPECPNMCEWLEGQGKSPDFCCAACKKRYTATRDRLVSEVALIEESLALGPNYAQGRHLRSMLARRRWALRRYTDDS